MFRVLIQGLSRDRLVSMIKSDTGAPLLEELQRSSDKIIMAAFKRDPLSGNSPPPPPGDRHGERIDRMDRWGVFEVLGPWNFGSLGVCILGL